MRRGTEWRWLSLCLATAYPHPQDPMSQNHSSCLKTNPHILKHHKTGLHIPKPGPTSQNQTLCPKTTLPVSKPVSKSPNQPMPIDPTRTENCCVTPPSTQQGDIALPAVLMEDPPSSLPGSEGHGSVTGAHPAVSTATHHRVGHHRGDLREHGRVGDAGHGAALFSIRRALTHRVGQSNRFAGFWHNETHPSFSPPGYSGAFCHPPAGSRCRQLPVARGWYGGRGGDNPAWPRSHCLRAAGMGMELPITAATTHRAHSPPLGADVINEMPDLALIATLQSWEGRGGFPSKQKNICIQTGKLSPKTQHISSPGEQNSPLGILAS